MNTATDKLDRGETMAQMWEGFAELTLPRVPVISVQYHEMQKAFYSGAFCLLNWMMVQMDEGTEPTDRDLARLDLIEAEIQAFMRHAAGLPRQ